MTNSVSPYLQSGVSVNRAGTLMPMVISRRLASSSAGCGSGARIYKATTSSSIGDSAGRYLVPLASLARSVRTEANRAKRFTSLASRFVVCELKCSHCPSPTFWKDPSTRCLKQKLIFFRHVKKMCLSHRINNHVRIKQWAFNNFWFASYSQGISIKRPSNFPN